MKKLYMGIDPGKDGGIGIVDEDGVIFEYTLMPQTPHDLFSYFSQLEPIKHVFLEKAQPMPKQGVTSTFNYGLGFGILQGLLISTKLPWTLIRPTEWTKIMCKGIDTKLDTKKRSLIAAQNLFPKEKFLKSSLAKKPHSGIYEACLIAEYCRRVIQ